MLDDVHGGLAREDFERLREAGRHPGAGEHVDACRLRRIGQEDDLARERGIERLPAARAGRRLAPWRPAGGRRGRCRIAGARRRTGVLEEREHARVGERRRRMASAASELRTELRTELLFEIGDPKREALAFHFERGDAGLRVGEGAERIGTSHRARNLSPPPLMSKL
jgi:hypothetical protein